MPVARVTTADMIMMVVVVVVVVVAIAAAAAAAALNALGGNMASAMARQSRRSVRLQSDSARAKET